MRQTRAIKLKLFILANFYCLFSLLERFAINHRYKKDKFTTYHSFFVQYIQEKRKNEGINFRKVEPKFLWEYYKVIEL